MEISEEKIDQAPQGEFFKSLVRNNGKIRSDRAQSIQEDAQMRYKRHVEDLEMMLKRLRREQANLLDNSPENTMTLKLATDFDSNEFVETHHRLSLDIRNKEIELQLAKNDYTRLFADN
jgi:hypothetical protein